MTIEEIGKQEENNAKVNLEEVLNYFEVALMEQGKELVVLKQRIAMLEYSLRKHANNTDNAHKI